MTTHENTTTTDTGLVEVSRPDPLATWNGDYCTPAQYLTAWMIAGGADWLRSRTYGRHGQGAPFPVVRQYDAAEGLGVTSGASVWRWIVVNATTGRMAPNYLPPYRDGDNPNPIGPNGDPTLIRVDRGAHLPEWLELSYAASRGWVVDDTVYISDDIGDPFTDDGYPRLCENHTYGQALDDLMERLDDDADAFISVDEITDAGGVFAEWFADTYGHGRELCTDCFDQEYPNTAYLSDHRLGEWHTTRNNPARVWDDADDMTRHADDWTTTTATVDTRPYGVDVVPPLPTTTADVWTWARATGRSSDLAAEHARRADLSHLDTVQTLWKSGEITADDAIAAGMGREYVELTLEQEGMK